MRGAGKLGDHNLSLQGGRGAVSALLRGARLVRLKTIIRINFSVRAVLTGLHPRTRTRHA